MHAQFLPYVGTVTNAPFGRIPTSFFGGEPNFDKFKREQEMLGYQFERKLSDSVTFRQNARFAHVDVNYTGVTGSGYANQTTGDLARFPFGTRGIANQAQMDSQVEYRFNTGILSHTTLFGLDLKYYSDQRYVRPSPFGQPSDQRRSIRSIPVPPLRCRAIPRLRS